MSSDFRSLLEWGLAFDRDQGVVAVVVQPCRVDIDSFPVDWDMGMVLGRVDHMLDSLAAYCLVDHNSVVAVVDSCQAAVAAFVVAAAKNWFN